MNKRGQQTIGLPFGMIFSIFLIVIFVVVAFLAIKGFLDLGKDVEIRTFYEDLQDKINDVWTSQSSRTSFNIQLPEQVTKVCFANLSAGITGSRGDYEQIELYEFSGSNVFVLPPEKAGDAKHFALRHINITEITRGENPYCISARRDLIIKKDFYDKQVIIE